MNRKWIVLPVLLLSVGVFGYSAYQYIQVQMDYQQGIEEYNSIRDLVKQTVAEHSAGEDNQEQPLEEASLVSGESSDPMAQNTANHEISSSLELFHVPISYLLVKEYELDFDSLLAINPQVKGWITINDTNIDYPVVQGETNQEYLRKTVDLQANNAGSIFIEAAQNYPFEQDNTIIYGHNQYNHQMFHDLTYYTSKEYWEAHKYITILTPEKEYLYEIFSFYQTSSTSQTYQLGFTSLEGYQEYLNWCKAQSVAEVPVEVNSSNRIITLSTCTNEEEDGRYIVQGKLIQER